MRALRGQTLVLFALMLLVLTVMVLGTVGIGVRAKQRVELQMVTDAAAYSEAVVTARTFNMVSVMNRVEVADMVVMAGQQSIISHSSQHYEALKNQLAADGGTVCNGHGGIQWPGGTNSGNLDTKWAQADQSAAPGAMSIQGAGGAMYPAELTLYTKLVTQDLVGQNLAQQIFLKAFPGQAEIKVPATGDAKSLNEVNGGGTVLSASALEALDKASGGGGSCSGAVCTLTADIRHQVLEAYGSEGWTWVRDRAAGGGETAGMSEYNSNGGSLSYGGVGGFHPGGRISDTAETASAHDHPGAITVTCTDGTTDSAQTGPTFVNSTELQDHGDEHYYNGTDWTGNALELGLETQPVWQLHTLGTCNVCHGFWPYFLDWNAASGMTAANEYNQPKLYAVAYRDFTLAPSQPWNLAFTFHFAASGTGTHYNAGTKEEANTSGTGLSRQGALSAAIVYYHRPYGTSYPDGWKEPPNFMNPFWRATLVSPEGANDDDPGATLTAVGLGQQATALNGLESIGFQGVHP